MDGRLVVRASTAGVLAYSGAPGRVTVAGGAIAFKGPAGKGRGYTSTKVAGGVEEIVSFRFPTAAFVAAANSEGVAMTFGMIEIEVSGAHLADFREFAARLNPVPPP